MAESYDVTLKIKVTKGSTKEPIVEEDTFFNGQSFAKMTETASEFYQLISKLKKAK